MPVNCRISLPHAVKSQRLPSLRNFLTQFTGLVIAACEHVNTLLWLLPPLPRARCLEGGHVSSRPAEDRDSMMLPPPSLSLSSDRAGSMKRINHETQRDEREDHAGIKK